MNYGGPMLTAEEARLRSMQKAIKALEASHAAEIEARAEEDNRCAVWDAHASGELAALKQRALALQAEIDAKRVHVQTGAQRELARQRQQRLAERAAALRAELADVTQAEAHAKHEAEN